MSGVGFASCRRYTIGLAPPTLRAAHRSAASAYIDPQPAHRIVCHGRWEFSQGDP